MNRRSFFGSFIAAPAILASAVAGAQPTGRRISVEKGDRGVDLWSACHEKNIKVEVYLDGVEVPYSLTADEAEGMVRAFKPNPFTGRPYMGPYDDRPVTEELRGHVEIRLIPRNA
jgi:hypothetical protein